MNLKAYLFEEDRGVSPVIGVILMVAITVILAAVIATFVMNMGPNEETVPTASWDITNESDGIAMSHEGGGGADASTLSVIVSYKSSGPGGQETYDLVDDFGYGQDVTLNASSSFKAWNNTDSGSTSYSVSTSDTGTVEMGPDSSSSDYKSANVESVQIIWNAENSDQSEVLSTWEA